MMANSDWRSFAFFDLRPDADGGRLAAALQDACITASTAGLGRIVVGDSVGQVHVFRADWSSVTFAAHSGAVALCELSTGNHHLVTIGPSVYDDEVGPLSAVYELKCWNLSKASNDGGFVCVRTSKLPVGVAVPSSLAVADSGQCAAVGYDSGLILLFRGDLKSSRPKDAEQLRCGSEPIVGMSFKQAHKTLQLFVCSQTKVSVYVLPEFTAVTLVTLAQDCKSNRCCVMQRQAQTLTKVGGTAGTMADYQFMVGQDDAVYCYNSDTRGSCYALEGVKSSLHWFRSHLITVYQSDNTETLTVIDLQNKVIGYKAPISDVSAILSEFGSCYVLTGDRRVLHLDERDVRTKLYLLFKQGLYDMGVRIANSNQYNEEVLAEIFKKYGDYLVQRDKHKEAAEQYVKTIGYLEPSYVIHMFLDPRHIDQLVEYLKALHEQGMASSNHTTLLLNCFTRPNKSDELERFLNVSDTGANHKDDSYDVDVAIGVCRSTAPTIALLLARQHARHETYVAILIEDQQLYSDAVAYMRTVPFADCERIVERFGTVLMKHCADQVTDLLKKLCTFYVPVDEHLTAVAIDDIRLTIADKMDLMRQMDEASKEQQPALNGGDAVAQRSDAARMMHLFGKRPDHLIEFCEHLLANLSKQPAAIYMTLVELYAARWSKKPNDADSEKIMAILRNTEQSCDLKQALVLCRLYTFWPGVLYIYEKTRMSKLVVRHHLKARNYDELFACCLRLCGDQPDIWFHVLNGLKSDSGCPVRFMAQVLQKIAQGKNRSPLQVVNCLAIENGPTLEMARDYFKQEFAKGTQRSSADEDIANALRMKKEIAALRSDGVQLRGTSCFVCGHELTLPAVYFLCKHNFHQECLQAGTDNEIKCPTCCKSPKYQKLFNAQLSQQQSRNLHDDFHHQIDRSADPFGDVLPEFLKKSLFNQLSVDENEPVDINKNLPDAGPDIEARPVMLSVKTPVTRPAYGLGAEATVRLQESQHMRYEIGIKQPQLPEARLRLLEADRRKDVVKPSVAQPAFRVPQKKPHPPTIAIGRAAVPKVQQSIATYDQSKNPFGDVDDETAVKSPNKALPGSLAKDALSSNPFGECDDEEEVVVRPKTDKNPVDSNLNPFE